tara:strand:+ start:196 stop:408 length:213 start_codon:yes stop_codon:yes gene_type:complete
MEQLNEAVGNPITLIIERFFWLGLGVFLGIAILSSVIRAINEKSITTKPVTPHDLERLAKKAIKKNNDTF